MTSAMPKDDAGSSPPVRILQCCAVDFTAKRFLLPLMREQRRWGFEVHFACSPGGGADEIQREGFIFHPVDIRRNVNPASLAGAFRALNRLMRAESFTVAHFHTPVAALLGRPAARRAGVPLVLYTAHGFYFHDQMPALQRRIHIGFERWAQRYADFLLTQSYEDAETAREERIAPSDRILAVGNGVDLNRFSPSSNHPRDRLDLVTELGLAEAGPLVLMMGRWVREKGYLELIAAWDRVVAEIPTARLICVGPALESERRNFLPRALDIIHKRRLEGSVVIAGPREDVPRFMRAADLFVLPSWREGMPRSILEAMACGLPVVATRIRGCREEVVDGRTGTLVPPRDVGSLAAALMELLKNPDRRAAYGLAGRRRAVELFNENEIIQRQEKVYRELFAAKQLPWPMGGDPSAG